MQGLHHKSQNNWNFAGILPKNHAEIFSDLELFLEKQDFLRKSGKKFAS